VVRDPISLVREYLTEHNPPLRVWLAPDAAAQLGDTITASLHPGTETMAVPSDAPVQGPAILIATALDIAGPQREALLAVAATALPGRPVICGGTADREVLLDAINSWRVFHLLPARPSQAELRDAVIRAHRATALEHAATLCAEHLRVRCEDLQRVLQQLDETREQLLQAERMTAVSGFSRTLSARLDDHLGRLHGLQAALGTLPDDPRRAELLDFTIQSIAGVEILLADLLDEAAATTDENTPTS